ncbi:MAG TPA: glycosyltransferase family 2 protein [Verrucomicrobiae bacterium]|nr:glycosyltransferase family 2 protein [Verrucomicrobiae bacterium]
MPPFFTVVIVNYNSGGCLARCLQALQAQRFRDFTVIVVDNASTDGSVKALDGLPAGWQAIRLDRNTGFAAGNNHAFALATSPWVAALNPDAFAEPDWLEQVALGIERYPEAGAFGSLQIDAASPGRLDGAGDVYHATGLLWRGGFGQPLAHQRGEGEIISPCAAAAVYRRDAVAALGGFDEDFFCYGEDVDLGFRLRLAGLRSIQLANAVVRHVGGASGGRRSDFALYHGMRNRLWLFVKVMPGPAFWLLAPIHGLITLVMTLRAILLGEARVSLRALGDGIRGLGGAWRKRRLIQRGRRGSPWPVIRLAPLAPLRRRPFLRPTEDVVTLKPATADGGVGVAIVSYNTGPLLMPAIDAALADPAVERVVVVDNGNPPEPRAMLARRAAEEPRLSVIEGQGNIGFAGGCNLAARHIDSEFLLLLNPDCLLPPGGAGLLREELRRRPAPALLGAVMVDSAGEVQRATRRNLPSLAGLLGEALRLYRLMPGWPRIEIEGPLPTETTAVPAISGAAMFLTRENYWALGGLDSGYFLHVEDLDLCARFRRAGGEVWLVPALRLQHGRSSSEATHLFIEAHKTRGFRRYFRKQGVGLAGRLLLEAALLARFALLAISAWLSPGSRGRRHESG